jgi:hypothetical protein
MTSNIFLIYKLIAQCLTIRVYLYHEQHKFICKSGKNNLDVMYEN